MEDQCLRSTTVPTVHPKFCQRGGGAELVGGASVPYLRNAWKERDGYLVTFVGGMPSPVSTILTLSFPLAAKFFSRTTRSICERASPCDALDIARASPPM
jgi:hypothetical protein